MNRETFFKTCLLLALLVTLVTFANAQTFEYESKGKRDPFVPLIGSGRAVTTELEDILSIEDVNLEGTAIGSQGKRIAIINGRILKKDERIGNLKIEKITNTMVRLSIDDKVYNLYLPEEGGVKSEK